MTWSNMIHHFIDGIFPEDTLGIKSIFQYYGIGNRPYIPATNHSSIHT